MLLAFIHVCLHCNYMCANAFLYSDPCFLNVDHSYYASSLNVTLTFTKVTFQHTVFSPQIHIQRPPPLLATQNLIGCGHWFMHAYSMPVLHQCQR